MPVVIGLQEHIGLAGAEAAGSEASGGNCRGAEGCGRERRARGHCEGACAGTALNFDVVPTSGLYLPSDLTFNLANFAIGMQIDNQCVQGLLQDRTASHLLEVRTVWPLARPMSPGRLCKKGIPSF